MIFGTSEWVVLLATLIGVVWYYCWKKTLYFKDQNIKSTDALPVFGNTLWLFFQSDHIIGLLENTCKSFPHEKYVGMFNFSKPVVLVKDPDLLKQICIKDFDHFMDHIQLVDPDADPVTGKMLFFLNGDQWRQTRNTLTPAFTSSKMRGMFPFMQECANYLVQYVDKKYAECSQKGKIFLDIELKDTFTRCTNDIIATCGFGIKTNSLVDTENIFYKMSKSITTFGLCENLLFGLITLIPLLSWISNLDYNRKGKINYFRELLNSNMKEREEKNIVRQDMIHLLMLAKQGKLVDENSEGKSPEEKRTKLEWTNDEILSQVLIFLFAGFDSTAAMLSFLGYELAKNPEAQKKLQEEIDEFLDRSNGEFDYEGIISLKYLDMVCSETLRLWPIVPYVDRVCTKTYVLPPQGDKSLAALKLKKDDAVWIPTMAIQRDSKYFPDPDKFIPERFSEENKHSIKPFSYFPFGLGPRQCIGTRFALMEVKVLIANLLSKYDLLKTPKTADPLVLRNSMFDMVPSDGYWVGLRPRIYS